MGMGEAQGPPYLPQSSHHTTDFVGWLCDQDSVSSDWFWLNSNALVFTALPAARLETHAGYGQFPFLRSENITLYTFLYEHIWIHLPGHSCIPGSIFLALHLKILFQLCCGPGTIWTCGDGWLNKSEIPGALIELTAPWGDRHWTRKSK